MRELSTWSFWVGKKCKASIPKCHLYTAKCSVPNPESSFPHFVEQVAAIQSLPAGEESCQAFAELSRHTLCMWCHSFLCWELWNLFVAGIILRMFVFCTPSRWIWDTRECLCRVFASGFMGRFYCHGWAAKSRFTQPLCFVFTVLSLPSGTETPHWQRGWQSPGRGEPRWTRSLPGRRRPEDGAVSLTQLMETL